MPMQAQIRGGSLASTYSQPGTRPLYARQKAPVRNVRQAGWASGSVRSSRKISPPPGVDPRNVQPVDTPTMHPGPESMNFSKFFTGLTADITCTASMTVSTDDGYNAKRLQSVKLSSASGSFYACLSSMLGKTSQLKTSSFSIHTHTHTHTHTRTGAHGSAEYSYVLQQQQQIQYSTVLVLRGKNYRYQSNLVVYTQTYHQRSFLTSVSFINHYTY